MDLELLIITGLALVAVLLILLRTHASLMIMATCAGFVLSELWSQTTQDVLLSFSEVFSGDFAQAIVGVVLFLLPPFLIGLHFRKTQSHRAVQQIVPSIFWVIFTSALAISFLPASVSGRIIQDSSIVFLSQEYLDILTLVAIIVALVEFMSEHARPKRGRPNKH